MQLLPLASTLKCVCLALLPVLVAGYTEKPMGFDASAVKADIIFTGGNIVTMDPANPAPEAVAIQGDRIVAVGERKKILALGNAGTRIVELGDRALVPGFIDAHGHLSFLAMNTEMVNLSSPPVGSAETMDDIVRLIKEHIANKQIPPGTWVLGYGYDDSLLAEKRHPTRDDLDQASTEHPIALMHVSGHLATVNSRALAERGVNANTVNPKGGIIRRRPGSNEPDGVLEELATFDFTMRVLNEMKQTHLPELIQNGISRYASYGITTIQEGGADEGDIAALKQAAAAQPFGADVVGYQVIREDDLETPKNMTAETRYENGFRVGGAKLFLDGSPQGRTAFMTAHYCTPPQGEGSEYVAYPTRSRDIYRQQVNTLLHRGVPLLVHANGDAAIEMMIDGVRQGLDGINPMPDHRSVIIHAQLMRKDQVDDAATLGMVASYFSAHTYYWGDWHRISFGNERAANISPTGWATERGLPFTLHNDSPVVPPDMMLLLSATVNRTTRSGHILGPGQRITPYQALYAITQGAAYQYFEENKKGSITVGKQADLVVLGANPLTIAPETIKDIPILETIAHGKTIYTNPAVASGS